MEGEGAVDVGWYRYGIETQQFLRGCEGLGPACRLHQDMQAEFHDIGISAFGSRHGGELGKGLFGHAKLQIALGGENRPLAHRGTKLL